MGPHVSSGTRPRIAHFSERIEENVSRDGDVGCGASNRRAARGEPSSCCKTSVNMPRKAISFRPAAWLQDGSPHGHNRVCPMRPILAKQR